MVALLWGELTAMGDWPSRVHQCRVVIDMPEAHRVPDFVRECVRHGTGAAWSLRAQPHMANTCPDERTTAGPVRIGYKFNRDPTDSIRRQALPAFDADHAHCPSGELMDRRACGVLERSHGGRREPRGLEVETWRLRQPPKRFHTPVQCASDELPVEGQVKARFRDQVHGGLRVLEPQLPCDVSRMAEGESAGKVETGWAEVPTTAPVTVSVRVAVAVLGCAGGDGPSPGAVLPQPTTRIRYRGGTSARSRITLSITTRARKANTSKESM